MYYKRRKTLESFSIKDLENPITLKSIAEKLEQADRIFVKAIELLKESRRT